MIRSSLFMVLLASAPLGLASAPLCLAAEPGSFRYSKNAQRPDAGKENILALTLDSDIYAATRDGLPDVRIFDRQNREAPYLLEKVTEGYSETVRETSASTVASLKEKDDAVELLVRLDAAAPAADGLTVHTPLVDYERRLRVLGSDDGQKWSTLVENGLFFDYSRFMDVRNSEIRLPKNSCRQLKVIIDAITDAKQSPFMELTRKLKDGAERERVERSMTERRPLRIDRLEFWHDSQREIGRRDKRADYPIVEFRAEQDAKEKTTLVRVRTRRQPLSELSIATSSRNFNREVVVEKAVARGGQVEWTPVAKGQIRLIDFRGFHNESLTVDFPEQRAEEYRIRVRNDDNPPLVITGVTARGSCYRAVFLAAADETYRVCYGADVEPPKYDVASVMLPLRQGTAAVDIALGPETANPAANLAAGKSGLWQFLNSPWALGAGVVVLVVLLAWALARAARRINQLPQE